MSTPFALFKSGRITRAFSLLESLVVLSLIAFLSLLSLHVLPDWWQRHALSHTVAQLRQSIYFGKTWALLHQKDVVLCGSVSGVRCDGGWSAGWLIVVHQSGQRLMVVQHKPTVNVRWVGNHRQRLGVLFNAAGHTTGQQGRFNCLIGSFKQSVVLIRSGRVRETPITFRR